MGRKGYNATAPYTYALPTYVDGRRMDSLVNMSASDRPPAGHESRHLWTEGGVTVRLTSTCSLATHFAIQL